MKTIKVVAAVIINDKKVFATQRGYGEFKDGWEFPGGKVEEKESLKDARWLDRENLDCVDWLPADQGLIGKIREYL